LGAHAGAPRRVLLAPLQRSASQGAALHALGTLPLRAHPTVS